MQLEFEAIDFLDNVYYQLEFDYLINYHTCTSDLFILTFKLFDDNIISEIILFDSNQIEESIFNDRWNNHKGCFQVFEGDYNIRIEVINNCNNANKFAVIDNVIVRQLDENADDIEQCQDIKFTSEMPSIVETTFIDQGSSTTEDDDDEDETTSNPQYTESELTQGLNLN